MNTDGLMFRRGHFPAELIEVEGRDGNKFRDFKLIYLPPYHPSMRERGIDPDLAVSVLDEVLEETVRDLEGVSEEMAEARATIDGMTRDEKGRIQYGQVSDEFAPEKQIKPFPILGGLFIGRRVICPCAWGEGRFIEIPHQIKPTTFGIPNDVVLPQGLMEEYEMEDVGDYFGSRGIRSPYGWEHHNVSGITRIFYKNLIIAIDNAVVGRKYSG
jgi:hypothetical protein